MRVDLRRPGGGGTAEVIAFGTASGHGDLVAASSTAGSAGNSSTGGITH